MLCFKRCVINLPWWSFLLFSSLLFIQVCFGDGSRSFATSNSLKHNVNIYDKLIRRQRSPSPHPRKNIEPTSRSECQDDQAWIPPGQRKKGSIPPGQQKKKERCQSKIPPGHRKRVWPPPIDVHNTDFVYPVDESTTLPQNSGTPILTGSNLSIILLRPEDIRK